MSATSVTLRGRAAAEARMLDACTITRSGGDPVFDPDTGEYTDPEPTAVYSGKCEVQLTDGLNASDAEAGGTEITLSRLTLKVPTSATGIEANDDVTITAAALDADLVGHEYRVLTEHAKSFGTARRLQVERVTA